MKYSEVIIYNGNEKIVPKYFITLKLDLLKTYQVLELSRLMHSAIFSVGKVKIRITEWSYFVCQYVLLYISILICTRFDCFLFFWLIVIALYSIKNYCFFVKFDAICIYYVGIWTLDRIKYSPNTKMSKINVYRIYI